MSNNKSSFYIIISIVTFIILAIGSTYAYFSATVTTAAGSDQIGGQARENLQGILSLSIDKVELGGVADSNNLVPADFGTNFDPNNMQVSDINKALTAKCVNNNYTGCHVWKITASTTQDVQNVSILLNLGVNITIIKKEDWSYAIYTGTDTVASNLATLPTGYSAVGNLATSLTNLDINNGQTLQSGTDKVYYVMVYINNHELSQNQNDNNNATGNYNGSVTMLASDGRVQATFTS